jgi:hypothetical protein
MSEVWVRAASTVNLSSLIVGTSRIDGVALVDGELVLLAAQVAPNPPNGIYTYNLTAGTLAAQPPFNTSDGLGGQTVIVKAGTTHAKTQWTVETDQYGSAR